MERHRCFCDPHGAASLPHRPGRGIRPFIATLVDGTGLIIYFEIAKLLLPELQ